MLHWANIANKVVNTEAIIVASLKLKKNKIK